MIHASDITDAILILFAFVTAATGNWPLFLAGMIFVAFMDMRPRHG